MTAPIARRTMLAGVTAAMLAPGLAWAQAATGGVDSAAARSFVARLIADVDAIARRTPAGAARQSQLRTLLNERFAVTQIAAFLLGSYRTRATSAQLSAYEALAPGVITSEFSDRIDGLAQQSIVYGETVERGARGTVVRTSFRRTDDQTMVSVDWLVIAAQGPRLFNIYVSGISPWVVKRQEFSSVIERQGFDALLTQMRRIGG